MKIHEHQRSFVEAYMKLKENGHSPKAIIFPPIRVKLSDEEIERMNSCFRCDENGEVIEDESN